MNIALYIIFSLIIIILVTKIYMLKKSLKEIERLLDKILKDDTNNLITTSSSDKDIKNLIIFLNKELRELRKQKLQYEAGNQELKKNITNISHDLRTPLTAINGYVDLLEKEELVESQKEYLSVVKKKVNELTELTSQLFDFSKTMDSNIQINKENCCINEILEETLSSYYAVLKEQNIAPNILICKEKVYKTINKISLIRIFENILSNVLKYSEGDLNVKLKENGLIVFSNKANELDETTVQKIFDRYFTVENAQQSTGIGLSIAKQLVELNGGNIVAKYAKGNLIIEIRLV